MLKSTFVSPRQRRRPLKLRIFLFANGSVICMTTRLGFELRILWIIDNCICETNRASVHSNSSKLLLSISEQTNRDLQPYRCNLRLVIVIASDNGLWQTSTALNQMRYSSRPFHLAKKSKLSCTMYAAHLKDCGVWICVSTVIGDRSYRQRLAREYFVRIAT